MGNTQAPADLICTINGAAPPVSIAMNPRHARTGCGYIVQYWGCPLASVLIKSSSSQWPGPAEHYVFGQGEPPMPGAEPRLDLEDGPPLTFGIYPGMTGQELPQANVYRGPVPDDPERTEQALALLQPAGRPFLVRSYVVHTGAGRATNLTPAEPIRYARDGRRLDFVACYRSEDGDLADWVRFVRDEVRRHGPHLDAFQVTEEPNNPHADAGGDGSSPNVRQALVEGVVAAKHEARRNCFDFKVGFAATPSFNPTDDFWVDLASRSTPAFAESLDYVGLDFYPDVTRPVPEGQLPAAVEGVLTHFRRVNLVAAGIGPAVPMRVTENGWPTGPGRSADRQAEVLETIVRAVDRLRTKLNITHYEFFLLRDGDSGLPELGAQFGLLRHDYAPKPAFDVYRRLIAELGADKWPA
jgi:hypothetical protein